MPEDFEEVVELSPADVVEEEASPAPVVIESHVVEPPTQVVKPHEESALVPVVQAAAAAATGFVAGAATLALVKRHSARRLARAQRRALTGWGPPGEWRTRTYLVNVHVLGRSTE